MRNQRYFDKNFPSIYMLKQNMQCFSQNKVSNNNSLIRSIALLLVHYDEALDSHS